MKQLVLAITLALSTSAGRAEEILPLAAISSYFNDLTTAQGTFRQFNDDGSTSTGTVYLYRPGRMRFEYDPPESTLVIAGNGSVAIIDPKSNQLPETYPLKRTPLSVILAETVDLDGANMVADHRFDGTMTIVTAQDPEKSEYGSIDLMFTEEPIELRRWVIYDGSGGQTTVVLDGLETGVRLGKLLFEIEPGSGANDR
jgi:outer membrane lipoprotein-sorting protein